MLKSEPSRPSCALHRAPGLTLPLVLRSRCYSASSFGRWHSTQRMVARRRVQSHLATDVQPLEQRPVERRVDNGVLEGVWKWRGYDIRYQRCGADGPPVVLVHGFGGNCEHWRKNLPVLGLTCRAFAVDLLGYGYSSKPDPRQYEKNELYCFQTWASQILDFISEIAGEPAFVICNSVGGIAGLQAAVMSPAQVAGVQVQNISLRMLHLRKQNPLQRPFVAALQRVLRDTPVGLWFFKSLARPQTIKTTLQQCYGDKTAVTDELVDAILQPGLEPGAAEVFLDFISYSGGPLPEDLFPLVKCPVSILWGEADPWEPIDQGRAYAKYAEEFVTLPGIGHCPMDEAPAVVNPRMLDFISRHTN